MSETEKYVVFSDLHGRTGLLDAVVDRYGSSAKSKISHKRSGSRRIL